MLSLFTRRTHRAVRGLHDPVEEGFHPLLPRFAPGVVPAGEEEQVGEGKSERVGLAVTRKGEFDCPVGGVVRYMPARALQDQATSLRPLSHDYHNSIGFGGNRSAHSHAQVLRLW